jgi:hypothetical protein
MNELNDWLKRATRCLSKDSGEKVRTEIEEHFDLASEAAIKCGASAEEASRIALRELGDADEANRAYRRVMLTSTEAKLLRESNLEARAICTRPLLKWTALSLPGVLLLASVVALIMHNPNVAIGSLLAGLLMALTFIAPFLPVYTRKRGLMVRGVRWALLVFALLLLFGKDARQWSWLLATCFWPMIWTEWKRISIRRKLPVAEWPKQLYL